jgi:hypothetical protein
MTGDAASLTTRAANSQAELHPTTGGSTSDDRWCYKTRRRSCKLNAVLHPMTRGATTDDRRCYMWWQASLPSVWWRCYQLETRCCKWRPLMLPLAGALSGSVVVPLSGGMVAVSRNCRCAVGGCASRKEYRESGPFSEVMGVGGPRETRVSTRTKGL